MTERRRDSANKLASDTDPESTERPPPTAALLPTIPHHRATVVAVSVPPRSPTAVRSDQCVSSDVVTGEDVRTVVSQRLVLFLCCSVHR